MANRFKATVLLPAVAPTEVGEVVSRKLTKTVNGGEPTEETFPANVPSQVFECNEGESIRLELRQIDNAGNVSEPSSFEFTVQDLIAPSAPGEMQVSLEEVPEVA